MGGQAQNPGLPYLRECISRSYSQARWLYELPGMAADTDSNEWAEGVRTFRIPQKYRGIGIATNKQGPPHNITSIQAGSTIDRKGNVLVGELITHIDLLPAITIKYIELPYKTSQISWARAFKPLTDSRLELEMTISDLTKNEGKELVSLSLGEAPLVRLWPKLRAHGFNTFDTIPRLNPTIARTKFSCPIIGSADTANTLLLTKWLNC